MSNFKTFEDLQAIREKMADTMSVRNTLSESDTIVLVSMDDCGIRAGAREILSILRTEVDKHAELKNVRILTEGCMGLCKHEPVIQVLEPGKDDVTYLEVDEKLAKQIVKEHLLGGKVLTKHTVKEA